MAKQTNSHSRRGQSIGSTQNQKQVDGLLQGPKALTQKQPLDMQRRFLLKAGAAVAGGMALGMSPFKKAEANPVNYSYSDLPPGFRKETCADENLIHLFALMYFGRSGDAVTSYLRRGLLREGAARDNWGNVYNSISKDTPLKEPAYWFTTQYYNRIYARNIDTIDTENMFEKFGIKKNSNMYNWAIGNRAYFVAWVDEKKRSEVKVCELYLTKAIVGSAGLKGRDEELRNAIKKQDEKAIILKDIQKGLAKASLVDKKIAAWSFLISYANKYRQNQIKEFNYIKEYNDFLAKNKVFISMFSKSKNTNYNV